MITIRPARIEDINSITMLFRTTVKTVNSKDYSNKQVEVWAAGADDTPKWTKRIEALYFMVAEINNTIVGFAYLTNGNYFDGLFVHKDFQGKGIAKKLLQNIELKVKNDGFKSIHSDVSITALPFFKKYDYTVERKQRKPIRGLIFENYIVSKQF